MNKIAHGRTPTWHALGTVLAVLGLALTSACAAAPPPLVVRLARAAAPLGKPLADGDYVAVRWTVDAGQADADILLREGRVALRRRRLRRLIEEARAQDAAPTDGDLARALNVNIRTVERDVAALRAEGHAVPTRRRKT